MKTLTSWMINVIVLLSFLSCSKKPIYQSRHEETIRSATSFDLHNYDSLKISGNNAFYIGVFNDDRKYTIRLKIIDETVQKKMLFFGFTVWIDTTGKQKQKLGITFQETIQKGEHPRGWGKGFSSLRANLVEKAKLAYPDFMGFKNSDSIQTGVNIDDKGNLYYFISVPFDQYCSFCKSLNYQKKEFGIGVISGKLEMESKENSSNGDEGEMVRGGIGGMGRGGMSGGIGRGGMGGGIGSGGMGGRGMYGQSQRGKSNKTDNLSVPLKEWIKVKLAE